MKGQLEGVHLYPIKSCAGIELTTARLTQFGVSGDRQWMIVNEHGKMLTQRTNPQLALIQPIIVNNNLWLQYPGVKSIPLRVDDVSRQRNVIIWRDEVKANLANDEVNFWVNRVLRSQEPLAMVHFDRQQIRQPGSVQRFGQTAKHFADAAPFLIANKASLDTLNQLLITQNKPTVDMRSFRPNLVISGLPPFAEHNLTTIRINGTNLSCVDHCERCVVITIDQDTAVKHSDMVPYKELASLNSMPDNNKAAAFGVNAAMKLVEPHATVNINDSVELFF